MKVTIDPKKLDDLKGLMLVTGGEPTAEQVKGLKIKDGELDTYIAELSNKWPETFPPAAPDADSSSPAVATPAPAPTPAPAAAAPAPVAAKPVARPAPQKAYRYIDENNLSHNLEVAKETSAAIFLRKPVPTDKVTVLIKRQPVEIDLETFKNKHADELHPEHGISYGVLRTLGQIAKG